MTTLPAWDLIECADYDELAELFWEPIPARTEDERKRVRRMAERMAELRPSVIPDYLPLPANHKAAPEPAEAPETTPQPPPPCKPKPKPKPPAPEGPDLTHFKSLFSR